MKTGAPEVDLSALADLRPYHLPEAPAWWPPAPGWWLVALVLLIVVAVTAWRMRRRWRRQMAARQAIRELALLRQRQKGRADAAASVRELSRLLRRFALAQFAHADVAALTGDAWLDFLDHHGGDGRFASGAGRQLIEAPYRETTDVSVEEWVVLVEDWVQRNREVRA